MDPKYAIEETRDIPSPALIVFREIVEQNVARMVEIAGGAKRLCPHCKTHKMAEVIRLELSAGIAHFKCATFAEAEMLAIAGARDVFLAYNLVGPNVQRAVAFRRKFPHVALSVTADDGPSIRVLGNALAENNLTLDVMLDIDTGMHRTGVPVGPAAQSLYELLATTRGVQPTGLHVYDGHNHQVSRDERAAAVYALWREVASFRDRLVAGGIPVRRIVAGGTGTFPIFAQLDEPGLLLSPGTCVFQDARYRENFPDQDFVPAALILTRVVSRPTSATLTLDVGNKAVASDPPESTRLVFPDIPDARAAGHNEEHLVITTSHADRFRPGDELLAIPWHICPTSALHKQAFVVADRRVIDRWDVTARDRWLTL